MKYSLFYDLESVPSIAEEESSESCSDFRSGDIRRKTADFCDVSGVFGAVCNHGFVFALMNIAKGESLAYSLGMISKLKSTLPLSRIVIAYDIFCRIATNLKCKADLGFIPAMHSLNHNDKCQSKFCPRRQLGFGHEDGEDSERFWSCIRFIASFTSVMRNENREDIITLICDSYNEKLLFGIINRFQTDLNRCKATIVEIGKRKNLEMMKSYRAVSDELFAANRNAIIAPIQEESDPRTRFIRAMLPDVRKFNLVRTRTMRKGTYTIN